MLLYNRYKKGHFNFYIYNFIYVYHIPERPINPDAQKIRTKVYIKNSRISNFESVTFNYKLISMHNLDIVP